MIFVDKADSQKTIVDLGGKDGGEKKSTLISGGGGSKCGIEKDQEETSPLKVMPPPMGNTCKGSHRALKFDRKKHSIMCDPEAI